MRGTRDATGAMRSMDTDVDRADAFDETDRDVTQRMSLAEEQLHPHAEPTIIGDVRAHREVHATDVTFELPLARQQVVIDRRRVWPPRPASSAVAEQTIVATLDAEHAVVDKPTVVTEEVVIRKSTVTDRVDITATARREEPVVHVKGDHRVRGAS